MYRGDGRHKINGKEPEISLLSLLNKENEFVSKLNMAYTALDTAKKNRVRLYEFEEDIKQCTAELNTARKEIRDYFNSNIGTSIGVSSVLYNGKEGEKHE